MRIETEVKLDFDDVLIRPKRSSTPSRSKIRIDRKYKLLNSGYGYSGVPIMAANMATTGTQHMARALAKHKITTCLHKHYKSEELIKFFREIYKDGHEHSHKEDFEPDPTHQYTFYTTGATEEDFRKLLHVNVNADIDKICVDVANGYTEHFISFLKKVRDKFPYAAIMAGNVATPEMVETLLMDCGVDIVKVGIGPGSVCTTRKVTGVGYPQLSAIIECADFAHGVGGHVCADGGCRDSGDIVKAFAAGSDFVMLGGMFAGCDECDGQWCNEDGDVLSSPLPDSFFKFYGMSSEEAMLKYYGGVKSYRAAEGKSVVIPRKGPAELVARKVMGGLVGGCSYVGATCLKELSKRTTFVRVNRTHNTVYGY